MLRRQIIGRYLDDGDDNIAHDLRLPVVDSSSRDNPRQVVHSRVPLSPSSSLYSWLPVVGPSSRNNPRQVAHTRVPLSPSSSLYNWLPVVGPSSRNNPRQVVHTRTTQGKLLTLVCLCRRAVASITGCRLLVHIHVTTQGKLLTLVCLCRRAVASITGCRLLMVYSRLFAATTQS